MNRAKKSSCAFLLVTLVAIILVAMFPVSVAAEPLDDAYYDYIITAYHIDVIAHSDNTYDITETIDVRFNAYRHGIYRDIPTRYDNKLTPVTNINTHGETTKIKNNGQSKYIRLGDANTTIIGDKQYIISYTLNMGKDEIEGADAIYLDLIGGDWYTNIYGVTFNIDMSELEGVDNPAVWGYTGYYGGTNTSDTYYETTDKGISGFVARVLEPYEALTIYVELPQDTFASAKDAFEFRKIFTYGVPLITLLLLFYWGVKYRTKRKPVPVVAFYPPESMNPTELGYVIDERVDSEDIGALIIYWASKGYLQIKEERFNRFTLVKTGEMSVEHKKYEVQAFNRLWKLGDGTQVKSSQLTNKYYTEVSRIQSQAKAAFEYGDKRLYDDKANKASGFLMLIASLCLGVLAFAAMPALMSSAEDTFGSGVMMAIFMMGAYITLCKGYEGLHLRKNKRKRWVTILFVFLSMLLYLVLLLWMISVFIQVLSAGEVTALVFVPLLVLLARPSIKQYTDYGFELLQQVLGFKMFIQTAEKNRLETLIHSDPQYIYHILPYAMVLGVSDIWAKKFDVLMTEPPNWYTTYGTGTFTTASLMRSMTRTTSSMSNVATSRPSSSGSSGGGGGGFSGGGGGGGGGGSW